MNEVTPTDTPVKRRPGSRGFQERHITDSSQPSTATAGDINNNKVKGRPARAQPRQRAAPPPPPARELGVHTLAVLEGHDNYVDIGGWAPGGDTLVTASTDKRCFLWT